MKVDETTGEVISETEEEEAEPTPTPGDPGEEEEAETEEAETEEEQPEEQPEAQLPPHLQPPWDEREAEARAKRWDKARDKHMGEARKADEYRYNLSAVCPLCEGHGLMFTPSNPEEQAQLRAFILALVGGTTAEELKPHPRFHRCDTCDGQGRVYTGSHVDGQDALPCPDCNGQGHSGGATPGLPTPLPLPTPATPTPPPAAEQERIGPDAWGRPPGHPHYGLLPAQVS